MMTTRFTALGIMAIAMMCNSLQGAESRIIAPGATVQKLAGDFSFTEGPASDAAGDVYFTDQPNDRIMRWSTDGKLTEWMKPAGRANGLCFDREGNLWACADGKNELWKVDRSSKATVVLKDYEGKLFNGPNDLWIHPKGAIYFSDPYYKRPYWQRGDKEKPQMPECVYVLSSDHKQVRRIIDDLKQPNGIIGTQDGKTLYVADIGARKTFRYSVQEDGTLADKQLFCELGSDGMTIDNEGNVYLTGKGVSVYNSKGEKIEQIDVPESWTANVCFGGKEQDTLFITASKGFYSLQMKVRGVNSQ